MRRGVILEFRGNRDGFEDILDKMDNLSVCLFYFNEFELMLGSMI